MTALPTTWCVVPLGSVTKIRTGKLDANAAKSKGKYPFFTCADQTLRIDSYSFDAEAVLLAGNGTFGVKWYRGKFDAYQRTYVIEPDGINGRYLYYLIRNCITEITKNSRGSTIKYLRLGDITDTPVPIPNLTEQKRIADKLDVLLAQVDACRARLDRVPAVLKRFRQAVLAAAVSGRLTKEWREQHSDLADAAQTAAAITGAHTEAGGHRTGNAAAPTEDVHDLTLDMFPAGWQLLELRELVEPTHPITYGILKPGPELETGVPYIRVADYPNDRLNVNTIRNTSPAIDKEFARSRLRPGDLLLSIRGTVGRVIVVPEGLAGANITQDSARLSLQPYVDRDYVVWFLRSETAQTRMKRAVKGVAVRGINIGDVRALQVPLPSLEEQREIRRRVETIFAYADRLESRYMAARDQIEQLTPSLLSKAFRGELVR